MPTFLETIWSMAYVAEWSRLRAEQSASRLDPNDPARAAANGAAAAAAADLTVTSTPEATVADLQTYIAALKP